MTKNRSLFYQCSLGLEGEYNQDYVTMIRIEDYHNMATTVKTDLQAQLKAPKK